MIVVSEDVVGRPRIQHRQHRYPLLNATDRRGNAAPVPALRASQSLSDGLTDSLRQRLAGRLGESTSKAISFRVLNAYSHIYQSRILSTNLYSTAKDVQAITEAERDSA